MFEKFRRTALKSLSIVFAVVCAFALFSCGISEGEDEPVDKPEKTQGVIVINPTEEASPADVTEAPEQTKEPAAETTAPKPTEEPEPTEVPQPTPYVEKYLDIWAIDHFYVVPGVKTEIKVDGNAADWSVKDNSFFSHTVENNKLYVTASTTGYINISAKNGAKAIIFSNLAVEKNDNRKAVDGLPYFLYYEKGSHTLTIYTKDSEGYYTVPFRTICTACGSTPDKTPVGIHKLGSKVRWKDFGTYCKAQYGINYAPGVFLHGPCYEFERESSILSHYYNTIGENSTGGCLRMQTGNIYWIYTNCESGTKLEIVNGSPRGTSCEIPEDIPDSACFDPTDPYIKDRV